MTLLKKFEPELLIRKKILVLPITIIILVAILEIWVVNRLASYGDQIGNLEQTQARLKIENQLLENKIAEKSSLMEAEKLVNRLGYQKVKNFEYIKAENLALNF